jgi:RNA polymerase sigma-70 factor (ECF subfamily)
MNPAASARADPIAAHRPRLFGLAYRLLGSAALAEDVVQEAFVRWYAHDRSEVRNEAAFLTTVVTHLSLDHLKSARAQREHYPGPWLPEPVMLEDDEPAAGEPAGAHGPPEHDVERLQSVSLAFLALLETLTPLERAVYVLHEVFDYSHAEVGAMLRRSEPACRQVYRRARQALHQRRPSPASPALHRQLLQAFLAACEQGDLDGLTRLLADDVLARSDGGGRVTAARRPLVGPRAVARLYRGLWRHHDPLTRAEVATVNGWPALLLRRHDVLGAVITIRVAGDRIDGIDAVVNPDKLEPLARTLGLRVQRPAAPAPASLSPAPPPPSAPAAAPGTRRG